MLLNQFRQRIIRTIEEILSANTPSTNLSELEKRICIRLRSNALGYLTELYHEKSTETLSQPIFASVVNRQKFQDLRLLQQMREACNIDDYLPSTTSTAESSDYEQTKRRDPTGPTIATGVTCGAAAGIITAVLSLSPIVIVLSIAGAGVGGAACAYLVNQQKSSGSVTVSANRGEIRKTFTDDMMRWLDAANTLYDTRVKELEAKLR